jgi:hypothetical protein
VEGKHGFATDRLGFGLPAAEVIRGYPPSGALTSEAI